MVNSSSLDYLFSYPVTPLTSDQVRELLNGTKKYTLEFDGKRWYRIESTGGGSTSLGQFQGEWDASLGTLPLTRTDGSDIQKGDYWIISVGGTISGLNPIEKLEIGDVVFSKVDTPTVSTDWLALQRNDDWSFDGVFNPIPAGTYVTGDNSEDFKALFFHNTSPSCSLSLSPSSNTIEQGTSQDAPTINISWTDGSNPTGTATSIEYEKDGVNIHTNNSPSGHSDNFDDTTVYNTSQSLVYRARVNDDQGRQSNWCSRTYTLNVILPYFWGIVSGGSKPTADQTLINSGNKVVADSNGTITINFNSTNNDWLWFAIPQGSTSKTKRFIDALNNGNIGSASDLFDAEQIVNIDDPTGLWNNENYKIYVSNYQSEANQPMDLLNN